MATTQFKGTPIQTTGPFPTVGGRAQDFELVGQDLKPRTLASWPGQTLVLNIFPSVDTPVCAVSVRTFNEKAGARDDVTVVNVSADLPFAAKRFCGAEGLEGVETCSTLRSSFARDYGVLMAEGPLAGLCARAVVVVNPQFEVIHAQLVPEVTQEPDYDAAWAALG